jgi:hypothetical protein
MMEEGLGQNRACDEERKAILSKKGDFELLFVERLRVWQFLLTSCVACSRMGKRKSRAHTPMTHIHSQGDSDSAGLHALTVPLLTIAYGGTHIFEVLGAHTLATLAQALICPYKLAAPRLWGR